MAIVVEDGTGLANAVSYLSVANADSHHAARGNVRWTTGAAAAVVTNEQKEAALVKATDFLDKFFGRKFIGGKYSQEQALAWPREDAIDPNGFDLRLEVPRQLKMATAELALRALLYDVLAPDIPGSASSQSMAAGATAPTAVGGEINKQRIKTGPLEVEIGYRTGSESRSNSSALIPAWALPVYSEAVGWVQDLLAPRGRELMRA